MLLVSGGCPRVSLSQLSMLLVLLAELWLVRAANSTYAASPFVSITTPFPNTNSKLLLKDGALTLDPEAGRFYMAVNLAYTDSLGPRDLHTVYLAGDFFLQAPSYVLFSYDARNCTDCCVEAQRNSPSMCPYLLTLTGGPFLYASNPSSASEPSETLLISESTDVIDPVTGKLMNFLGAFIPFTWTCDSGSGCAPLGPVPVPLPANAVRALYEEKGRKIRD